MSDRRTGAFISHIAQEKPVALKVQEYLKRAFGPGFPVFVSSDETSIGGGRKWFEHIVSNLRAAKVILVLVSHESCYREWINFESGFGEGTGACVIPVAIKTFTFDKLRFPLAAFNGRYVADLEGILFDIVRETELRAGSVDAAQYRDDILESEKSLIYKTVVVTPSRDCEGKIRFTIQNTGNVDLDLIMFEAWMPIQMTEKVWPRPDVPGLLKYESIDGNWYSCYTTALVQNAYAIEGLRPVLTPSMGKVRLAHPSFPLISEQAVNLNGVISYHLHVRSLDTVREFTLLSDLVVD
jgi:hypothetical protein